LRNFCIMSWEFINVQLAQPLYCAVRYVPTALQFYSILHTTCSAAYSLTCEIRITDFSTPLDAADIYTIFLTDHHNGQSRILKTGNIEGSAIGPHELCLWTMPILLFSEQKAIFGGLYQCPHGKRKTVIQFVK